MPPKHRSPRYPSIGLSEAVEKIRDVYKEDYQNQIPRKLVAAHMGYASLHGKALGVLSSLGKYGLLEGRGDENKVSDLAVRIIAHDPGSPEWNESICEAASKPELFSELDQRFANGKASDSAIRAYLLTAKFLPDAAETVVRSYRDTKQLVASASGEYNAPSDKAAEPIKATPSQEGRQESSAAPIPATRSQSGGVRLMDGERELTTGLLSKDASFRLIVSGNVGEKEIDRLIAKLTIDKEILAEASAAPTTKLDYDPVND